MIIPARWFSGGRGLNMFRKQMLNDRHLRFICDYFNSTECFPGVDISGGICYFLWDRDNKGDCLIRTILNDKKDELIQPSFRETS